MAKEILMPKMGMTMETGTVLNWYVKEGDAVEKGDLLLSVETDKAVLDVEAFESGTVLKILVPENVTVPVLTKIGYIGRPGEPLPEDAAAAAPAAKEQAAPAAAPASEAAAPAADGGLRATPLAKALCAEKSLALSAVTPDEDGIIRKRNVLAAAAQLRAPKATPVAAEMARRQGIDLVDVPHDGSRIYKQDVANAVAASAAPAAPEAPAYMELSRVQKVAGEMLSRTWQTMPMVTNCIELDVTDMLRLVDFLNEHYGRSLKMKFGLTDIMIKVLAQAMAQNPNANVYLEEGRLRCLDTVSIGVAAATPRGLLVPVIRNADKLNIMEINREKNRLVTAAREGKLSPADMGGASTSYSNMGAYRAEMFTPIINYPESCIFGTGTVQKKPVVRNDEIVIRPMMWLNFTYDHRILDGEKAAKLLNAVKDVAEIPSLFIGYEGGAR